MQPRTFSILGIPVEYLDTAETIEKIIELINIYRTEHPRNDIATKSGMPSNYISTMNLQFLSNVHGWSFRHVKHPELLNILRKSAIVTPDGMPIVWLSRWLGNPLKERVTGVDLVPLLAEVLGEEKKSMYLLGGDEKVSKQAVEHLKKVNPNLEIVGTACPHIFIEGQRLVLAQHRDSLLIEEINKASPDVLLISLGHPKQEIWFERIRRHVRVPLAIGIGGTFDFLTGKTKRAPQWMRSLGLEWLHRFYQEPIRLLSRYLYSAIHFFYLAFPLVVVHRLNQFYSYLTKTTNSYRVKDSLLFLSQKKSIAVVRLPEILASQNAQTLNQLIDEAFAQDVVLLDFQQTRHIDLEGFGLLVNTWKRAKAEHKKIFGFAVKWNVRLLMRMHKVWDLFSHNICLSPLVVTSQLAHDKEAPILYDTVHQKNNTLTLSFFGRLDNTQDSDSYLEKFIPMLLQKDCVLDFTYCTFIDNAGFCFLLKLKQFVEGNKNKLTIKGLSPQIVRQFRLANMEYLL